MTLLRKLRRFFPLAAGLTLLIVMAVLLMTTIRRTAQAEHTLEENRLWALSEAAEMLQSLSLNMEKLLVSADPVRMAALSGDISGQAGEIRRALAFLPLTPEVLSPAMTAMDSLISDVTAVLPRLMQQGALTPQEEARLENHRTVCTRMSGEISALTAEVLSGSKSLSELLISREDGPLPTQAPHAIAGFVGEEITAGEAITIARNFVGSERVTSAERGSDLSGDLPAWGVVLTADGMKLHCAVSRQGGCMLYILPETADVQPVLTSAQCRSAAEAFLASRGFPAMTCLWQEQYSGLCVFTFCPMQDGVLLYPDRLTLQVRMDTGAVCGLEAEHYWRNHRPRSLPAALISQEDARNRLKADVTEQGAQLCLISSGDRETLCWEFSVTRLGEQYLIYLDAATGQEVLLQKILPRSGGHAPA